MSKLIRWAHIKDALPPETVSEIHHNALILREAITKAKPGVPFSIAMAEEVCIALFCRLLRRVPKELR